MAEYEIPPKPSNEIKTLRKIGYTLETSVADIIDNSVAAKATKIHIEIPISDKEEPYISITDDGIGMTKGELIENMRLGCKDPDQEREPGDLGRFGSGMKTASFSQAKKLIVISKTEGKSVNAAVWDIDRIVQENKWILETLSGKELSKIKHLKIDQNTKSGTQVLWLKIDRYSKDREDSHTVIEKELVKDINLIRRAIAVLFHRYLKVDPQDKGIKKIKVFMNNPEENNPIKAIDPFMRIYPGYQFSAEEKIYEKQGTVNIIIHNVPHPDRLTKQALEDVGGAESYNAKQGFYIYRDKRLMIEGEWLGTHAAGILGNRARVQVDMPSKMDKVYGTDVKKASFQFPPAFKRKLTTLSRVATNDSKKDYKRRAKTKSVVNEYWDIVLDPKTNTTEYRIKPSNSSLKEIMKNLKDEQRRALAKFLINLAKYLPLKHILYTMANRPKSIKEYDDWSAMLEEILKKSDG